MAVVRNFAPISPNEIDRVAFDFAAEIGAAGTISSAAWTCELAAGSPVADAAAAARVISFNFTDYATSALVGLMVEGAIYQLQAIVNISDGRVLSQTAGIACLVEILPGGGVSATKLRIFQDASRFLADARFSTITDDTEVRRAFDDAFPLAAEFVLRQAPWRIALKTAPLVANAVTAPGFSKSYSYPGDWLRTHAIFLHSVDGRECPLDLREQGLDILTNSTTAPIMRYVSSDYVDPDFAPQPWPEGLTQSVAAYLAFLCAERVTGERSASGRMSQLFSSLFEQTVMLDAVPEDPWIQHQRSGEFRRASHAVMARGYWWWALKEVQYDTSAQLMTSPDYGFPYRFPLPEDWFRTHALFVPWDGAECPINIRESANDWSTDAETFVARYVSTDVLDATKWPEIVARDVLAYLEWQAVQGDAAKGKAQEFAVLLSEAMSAHSRPEDDWRRFQLDGSYIQAVKTVLEKGRWRFAVRTVSLTETTDPIPAELADGTPSSSYTYRHIWPNDLLRTIWVYHSPYAGIGGSRTDIDFRDEGGAIHANHTPVTLRYVSRFGLDSTRWPANFRRAVHACLLHLERPDDPKLLAMYRDAEARAEGLDDARDMPPIRNVGRFVAARRGWSSYDRKQGL